MPTTFAALMCHAPIVLPAVGGSESGRCVATTRAMREIAWRIARAQPDRVVLLSPHSPRRRAAFGAWRGPHRGSLADFHAPQLAVELPDAPEVAEQLHLELIQPGPLDHGAMVPLAFLWEAGWRGPTAILALPWDEVGEEATGRAIAALPGSTAVIASGDMSHRLKPGAPAGYHPQAQRFDRTFVNALISNDWSTALHAPHREDAAEDVVQSTAVAMASVPGPLNAEVLHYEGPWGVGYTEAVLYDPSPPLAAVARMSIRAHLDGRRFKAPDGGPPTAGVFVSLHRQGDLRGCIGHIEPIHSTLYEEISDVAVSSAVRDDRFPPLGKAELSDLDIEVSVLEPPEPIDSPAELDPRIYGVIVSSGRRRGLLLPDLEGVDTVEQQLRISRRKAGIGPQDPVKLERFTVRKERLP